jgi:hypothetical protein
MRRAIVLAAMAALTSLSGLRAQEAPVSEAEGIAMGIDVGFNALAPFSFLVPYPINQYYAAISGLEYGIACFVNVPIAEGQEMHFRLSAGIPSVIELALQCQIGYRWFPFPSEASDREGFHVGGALRAWDVYSTATGHHRFSALPLIEFGWRFAWGDFFLDLGCMQTIAIASASTQPRSTPAVAWCFSPIPGDIPILPWILIDLGWRL